MTRPLVALVMILRDEAKTVRATLESAKSFVDHFCILDTGSTDGTQDLVTEVMSGVPGLVHEGPFGDYSAARNMCLDAYEDAFKQRAVFTLFLNADEILIGGEQLRTELEKLRDASDGAYCVKMRVTNGSTVREWPYTRVLRVDVGWRYQGARHERPVGSNGEVDGPLLPGVIVEHRESDPARKLKRLREQDLPHFQKIVDDESLSLEERAHAIFFLAETHAVLAGALPKNEDGSPLIDGGPYLSHQMAAMALYYRYALIAEQPDRPAYDANKVHYALVLYHNLAEQIGIYDSYEMAKRMEALVAVAPEMPEARFLLAKHAMRVDVRKGLFRAIEAAKVAHAARSKPTREVTEATLEWRCWHMAAACAQAMKNEKQAAELMKRAIAAGAPPELLQVRKENGT